MTDKLTDRSGGTVAKEGLLYQDIFTVWLLLDLLDSTKMDSVSEIVIEGTKKKIEDIRVVFSSGITKYYQVKTKGAPRNWTKNDVMNIIIEFLRDNPGESEELVFISDGNPASTCIQLCDLIIKIKKDQELSFYDNQIINEIQQKIPSYSVKQIKDLLKKVTIDLQKGKFQTIYENTIYKAGMFLQIRNKEEIEQLIECILSNVYKRSASKYSWERKFDKNELENLINSCLPPKEPPTHITIKKPGVQLDLRYTNGAAPMVENIILAVIKGSKNPSKYSESIEHTSKITNLHKQSEYGKTESLKEVVKEIEVKYIDGVAPEAQMLEVADFALLCQSYLLLGDADFHRDRFADAELKYRKAYFFAKCSKENSIIETALYELGAAIGMQMRHEEALSCFKQLLEMNAENASAWFNVGVAYSFLKKYQDAIDSYLKAIEFGEKASDWGTVATAYYNMGISQGKLKKYQDAIDSYLKAIELRKFLPDTGARIFPTTTLLICLLGMKNIQEKNHDQAKELAERLAYIYVDGEKDGMVELIAKTIGAFESKLSKEDTKAFQEFKKLYEKSKSV